MYYNKELLLSIVGEVKKGDIVKIKTCFKEMPLSSYNTILITDDKGSLKAVWCDEEYKGKPYLILDYQVITEIVKRDVNVEEYLESINPKMGYETETDKSFLE